MTPPEGPRFEESVLPRATRSGVGGRSFDVRARSVASILRVGYLSARAFDDVANDLADVVERINSEMITEFAEALVFRGRWWQEPLDSLFVFRLRRLDDWFVVFGRSLGCERRAKCSSSCEKSASIPWANVEETRVNYRALLVKRIKCIFIMVCRTHRSKNSGAKREGSLEF